MSKPREFWIVRRVSSVQLLECAPSFSIRKGQELIQVREVSPAFDACFDEMKEAIAGALRIKDLWLTFSSQVEHIGEAEATHLMLKNFEDVLEKAESLK